MENIVEDLLNCIMMKAVSEFNVLAKTLGFLAGSFPMEPWTKMKNKEKKRLWNFPCNVLMWSSKFLEICMWGIRMIDNVLNWEILCFNHDIERLLMCWSFQFYVWISTCNKNLSLRTPSDHIHCLSSWVIQFSLIRIIHHLLGF